MYSIAVPVLMFFMCIAVITPVQELQLKMSRDGLPVKLTYIDNSVHCLWNIHTF